MLIRERTVLRQRRTPGSVGSGFSMKELFDDQGRQRHVVQANDKCILKVGSRRRAAQLISDATDLLNALAVVESPDIAPSAITRG